MKKDLVKEWSEGFMIMDEDKLYKYVDEVHRTFVNMAMALDVDRPTKRDVVAAMHDRTMVEKALVKALVETRKNQG